MVFKLQGGHLVLLIWSLLDMPIMPEGLKYLGMPVFWGRNKSNWLSPLISRIEKRLSNSSLSSLPFAGRSCLVQSVSNTMSNYLMSCFTLSQKIIRSINKSQAKFWWGKRVDKFCRLIKWDSLCQPGSLGGVGISNLSYMNIALVTKLAWRIISQPSSIFRVVKGKYERGTGWW